MIQTHFSSQTQPLALRCATYLSPVHYETHAAIARYICGRLGYSATLTTGQSTEDFAQNKLDLGFLCGLLYTQLKQKHALKVILLAAPVPIGTRYHGKPIYFSDVVVRRESRYTSFADLRDCQWAYNECASHSGWNLVRYHLHGQGETLNYFGRLLASGSHLRSLDMVLQNEVDAAAIDSQILDLLLQKDARLAAQLRVIGSFGPSPAPPLIASTHLDGAARLYLREILSTMHQDSSMAEILRRGGIERFVPVNDGHYAVIRNMFDFVQTLDKQTTGSQTDRRAIRTA
jgi:phosphonate transport system substrate-binding protein